MSTASTQARSQRVAGQLRSMHQVVQGHALRRMRTTIVTPKLPQCRVYCLVTSAQQGEGDGATGWEDAWDETSPGDALLLDRLREAKRSVLGARLLTKHGLPTSAAELAAADAAAAARMLRQLFVRMASSIGITDARWRRC